MLRVRLVEKSKLSKPSSTKKAVEEIILDERFFSSKDMFYQWYEKVKHLLWENDPTKVDTVEGVYILMQEVEAIEPLELDNLSQPAYRETRAVFKPENSYKYAV